MRETLPTIVARRRKRESEKRFRKYLIKYIFTVLSLAILTYVTVLGILVI